MLKSFSNVNKFVGRLCLSHCFRNNLYTLLFTSKPNYSSEKLLRRSSDKATSLTPVEIRIETPYGHIAGKLWNRDNRRTPILACHGWLDNAGTWDHLIPYLDAKFPILAIDFPGHGLSSPKPFGLGGILIENLLPIERVVRHFNWKRIILLGHSMGGSLGMLYSGTFPAKVEKPIMVDAFEAFHVDAEDQPETTALSIQEILKVEEKQLSKPPRYSYSEIVAKTMVAYQQSLSEESAKTLLKRGSQKHDDDDTFTSSYSPIIKTKNILS